MSCWGVGLDGGGGGDGETGAVGRGGALAAGVHLRTGVFAGDDGAGEGGGGVGDVVAVFVRGISVRHSAMDRTVSALTRVLSTHLAVFSLYDELVWGAFMAVRRAIPRALFLIGLEQLSMNREGRQRPLT